MTDVTAGCPPAPRNPLRDLTVAEDDCTPEARRDPTGAEPAVGDHREPSSTQIPEPR